MTTALIVLVSVLGVFVVYLLVAPLVMNSGRFSRAYAVHCPVRQEQAHVRVGSWVAGLSSAYGAPLLVLGRCSLLEPGQTCAEGCLKTLKT